LVRKSKKVRGKPPSKGVKRGEGTRFEIFHHDKRGGFEIYQRIFLQKIKWGKGGKRIPAKSPPGRKRLKREGGASSQVTKRGRRRIPGKSDPDRIFSAEGRKKPLAQDTCFVWKRREAARLSPRRRMKKVRTRPPVFRNRTEKERSVKPFEYSFSNKKKSRSSNREEEGLTSLPPGGGFLGRCHEK